MKKYLFLLIGITILGCTKKTSQSETLAHYAPKDAAIVFSIKSLDIFTSNLQNNEFIYDNSEFHLNQDTKEVLKNLKYIKTPNSALLSFSKIGQNEFGFTFITKDSPNLIQTDSIANKTIESQDYSNKTIKKLTLENSVSYATTLDSIFIASNSKLLIENAIRNYSNNIKNQDLKELIDTSGDGTSVFINTTYFNTAFNDYFSNTKNLPIEKFTTNLSLDLEISQKTLQLNGVAITNDSIPKILDIFKGVEPQETHIAKITPLSATGFYSFTYNSFEILRENLKTYHAKDRALNPVSNEAFFNSLNEVGVIYNNDQSIVTVHSLDPDVTEQALISQQDEEKSYRDVTIFKLSSSNMFTEALNPLITIEGLNYYTRIKDYYLFAKDTEAIENIIANYQNKSILGEQDYYIDVSKSLSDESSILMVTNTDELKSKLPNIVDSKFKSSAEKIKFKDHKLAALQFIYERNFAHVHAIIEKAGAKSSSNGISQVATVKLDASLQNTPRLFKNHTNKTRDIVVQDVSNTLYLISNKGKIKWKKNLGAAILGDITEVDLYRNGKYQLAFTTQDKLYVLDRNGKEVENFPIEFKDPITQPLAVFDYDRNRKYRFLVTQGNSVLMYNKDGKRVSGFKFDKADKTIVTQPKHIRIGSRDYILVMSNSGKLNILSRTGTERVSIKTNLDISDNNWYKYENTFANTNENGELMQISEKGKLNITKLGLPQDHYIESTNKTFVSLAENKLTIKGKTIELDFGLYTRPQIFYINNKIYVSVTDTQSHKVYLFDSNGILRPNFPVYGNSQIDFENMDSDNNLEFVVKGEEDSVLIYKVN